MPRYFMRKVSNLQTREASTGKLALATQTLLGVTVTDPTFVESDMRGTVQQGYL